MQAGKATLHLMATPNPAEHIRSLAKEIQQQEQGLELQGKLKAFFPRN